MIKNEFFAIVIGNGPSGCSGAIYLARGNKKVLLFTGGQWGGHLTTTTNVYNYIGYRKIDGYDLMKNIMDQVIDNDIVVKNEVVNKIDFERVNSLYTIYTETEIYYSKYILIATGATHKHLDQINFNKTGIYYCATCDGSLFRYNPYPVVVVGGGNTALTESLYLSEICKEVILIHRRNNFRGEKFLIDQVKKKSNIIIKWNSEIVTANGKDFLEYIEIYNKEKEIKEKIITNGLFVAIGFLPNTKIFLNTKLKLIEGGYIQVNEKFETNLENVYAVGDVVDNIYRQAITGAGDGAKAAINILNKNVA